jgi:GNAT superfamily N-acetyltransferase
MFANPSVRQRGPQPAITAVLDDFVGRVAADKRINGKFANADIPRLKRLLVEQICQASGGPCTYTGRDMKTTHGGMQITGRQFDALVEERPRHRDLGRALGEAVSAWADTEGYASIVTDWRETNLLSSRFWRARGFRPSFLRLYRHIP